MRKISALFWVSVLGIGLSAQAAFAIPPGLFYLRVYYSDYKHTFDATAQFNASTNTYDVINGNQTVDSTVVTSTDYMSGSDVRGQMSGDYSVPQLVYSDFPIMGTARLAVRVGRDLSTRSKHL